MSDRAALIVGAGDHLGTALARRFARMGLKVVATRRRGDLAPLVASVQNEGGWALGVHSDAREEAEVEALLDRVESEVGPLEVVIYNVGGNVRFGLTETTARVYRKVWQMCAFGGFLVTRGAAQRMRPRGRGTILLTGATAALRGVAGFAAFAGGKHALRALAQSAARELAPEGIHVAHVIIDGPIDNDSTRALFPEAFDSRPDDGVLPPDDIAAVYAFVHEQPRSAWTFEIDVRTYVEPW